MKNVVKSLGVLAAYFVVQIIVQMVFMAAGIAYGIRSENGLLEFSMDPVPDDDSVEYNYAYTSGAFCQTPKEIGQSRVGVKAS